MLYSVDLGECAAIRQLTAGEISETFAAALEAAGATIVQVASHTFPGAGLTCVLLLSESHAVLHTWPETGTVNIDIFSCSTRLKSLDAIAELGRLFGARQDYRPGNPSCRRTPPRRRFARRVTSRCGPWPGASASSACSVCTGPKRMSCCRSPGRRRGLRSDCSAHPRRRSRSHSRAAGPTRWRCASAPSSPTRCRGEGALPERPAAPR